MKFRAALLCLAVAFPLFAQDRDGVFLAARDAFRAGDRNRLDRGAGQIGNHELAPYVENYQLRMSIDQGDTSAMRSFFARNDGTYVAERLRADCVRWLGKRGMWGE